MSQGALESYRVRCAEGCHEDRLLVGKESAERGGRRHHEQTGHLVLVEAVAGGETIGIDD